MPASELDPWQFRISEQPGPRAMPLGRLFLEAGPDINVIGLSDRAGVTVGKLIGFPIDLHGGRVLVGPHNLAFSLGRDPDQFAEAVITSLGGRFLFIFETDEILRIYPDCSAQVPCVYDPAMRTAASTSHAMLDEVSYWERFDRELYDRLDITREGWFPAGLTAHIGIERVLPNHYLDLQTWTMVRHWPRSEIVTCENPAEIVAEFVELIQSQLEALAQGPKRIAQALTAGRETRTLLACAYPFKEQITFVTVTGADRFECDTVMARRIAQDQGLQHIELSQIRASAAEQECYVRRGGHSVGDTNAIYHPSVRPLNEDYVFVGGAGGEVGRAFFWHNSDTPETQISEAGLIRRMGLPPLPKLTDRVTSWLANMPLEDALKGLDLAYIELRMGPWGGAQFCNDPKLVRFAPIITRRTIELLLSLPASWKRDGRLFNDIVKIQWPEIDRYPYNSLGVWNDNLIKVRRVLKNPNIVLKKIRKYVG